MNSEINNLKKITSKILVVILFIILGCSENNLDIEQPNPWVDTNVLKNNDWKMAEEILLLVNKHRSDVSKSQIIFNRNSATALAIEHCQYMIDNNEISHKNFSKRNQALNKIGATNVGENIAYGYALSSSVVNAWINSPSHKIVLEGNYNHMGIGVIKSFDNKNYITAIFYTK